MSLVTYRYGTPRSENEGLRIGVARHLPRGVRREDWQRKNYFDIWLPLVAPSPELVFEYRHERIEFKEFARQYRLQMKAPAARQGIQLVAVMACHEPVSLGCYCEDETRCHRSLLRALVEAEMKSPALRFLHNRSPTRKIGESSGLPRFADLDED
jgi:uncharacterized protein YeaO (DUF488 family)